jgi:hypothetical protein
VKVDHVRGYRPGVPVSQLTDAELDALIAEGDDDDEDWDDEDDEPSEEERWQHWENADDPRDRAIARTRRELGLSPERIPARVPDQPKGNAAMGQGRPDPATDDWAAGLRPVGKQRAAPPAPRLPRERSGRGPPYTPGRCA